MWALLALAPQAFADDPILPPLEFTPVVPPTPYPTRTPFAANFCPGGLRPNIDRCLGMKRDEAIADSCCRILFLDAYSCSNGGGVTTAADTSQHNRFVGEAAGSALTVELPCSKPGADLCTKAALTHCEDVLVSGKLKPGLKTQIGAYLDLHFKGGSSIKVASDPIFGSLTLDGSKGKIKEYYEGKDFKLLTAADPLNPTQANVSAFPKPACDLLNDQKAGAGTFLAGNSACGTGTKLLMHKDNLEDDDDFNLDILDAQIPGRSDGDQREAAYLGGSWIAGVKCHLNEVKAEIKAGKFRISPMCLAAAFDVEEIQRLQLKRMKEYFAPNSRTASQNQAMCGYMRDRDFLSWLAKESGQTVDETCGENSNVLGPDGQPLAKGPLLRMCYFEAARKMINQGAVMQLAVCEVYARSDRQMHCGFRTSSRILENERNRKDKLISCAEGRSNPNGNFGLGGQNNISYDWGRCDGVNWDKNIDGCQGPTTGPCFLKGREAFYKARVQAAFDKPYCTDPGDLSGKPETVTVKVRK